LEPARLTVLIELRVAHANLVCLREVARQAEDGDAVIAIEKVVELLANETDKLSWQEQKQPT
jgi:hypothetical protein